jgi:hypothetical protein
VPLSDFNSFLLSSAVWTMKRVVQDFVSYMLLIVTSEGAAAAAARITVALLPSGSGHTFVYRSPHAKSPFRCHHFRPRPCYFRHHLRLRCHLRCLYPPHQFLRRPPLLTYPTSLLNIQSSMYRADPCICYDCHHPKHSIYEDNAGGSGLPIADCSSRSGLQRHSLLCPP